MFIVLWLCKMLTFVKLGEEYTEILGLKISKQKVKYSWLTARTQWLYKQTWIQLNKHLLNVHWS